MYSVRHEWMDGWVVVDAFVAGGMQRRTIKLDPKTCFEAQTTFDVLIEPVVFQVDIH